MMRQTLPHSGVLGNHSTIREAPSGLRRAYGYGCTGQTETERNMQRGESRAIPVRLLPVPSPAIPRVLSDVTSSTESGESFAHGITDAKAAVALELHPLGLSCGQERVADVGILSKDRVVEAAFHAAIVVGESIGSPWRTA